MPQNKTKRDNHLGDGTQLPGFPGYRTRAGRTGYDPLDTNREAAFMEGTLYRNAFTFRLRTRKVVYLVMMFLFGVIPFIPFIFITIRQASDAFQYGDFADWFQFLFAVLCTFVTGAITINFLLSILEILKIIPPLTVKPKVIRERKKKLPKRRKDFR